MNKPCKKLSKSLAGLLAFALTLLTTNFTFAADAPKGNADNGAKLFKANCAVCHSTGTNKVTGPGLAGVTDRVPQPYQEWMHKWILNNAALRKSGDAYANKVYADNGGTNMTVFDGTLNDAQVDDIIAFLKNPPKTEEVATTTGIGGSANAAHKEEGIGKFWILLIIIAILLIIVTTLRTVRKSLLAVVHEKKGLPPPPEGNIWQDMKRWIRSNKMAFVFINLFITAVFCVYGWEYLWGIDVTPGYHPDQPIAFSHKVHAGDNAIQCIYCHSGAEKGKVAGVPTLNVCMNCHKGIQGSNPDYQKEIAKIYYAVGWDASKGAYTNPTHPIEWTRVHNLPDFAYFNHSQHVVVGKIACQTCHGDCATYTTNQQFAPLTMGWCVDCHRKTPVQMEGNGYYAKLHEALKAKYPEKEVTEADMGGLECAKCHY
jgi:mono/diheme cytochrome c family protein